VGPGLAALEERWLREILDGSAREPTAQVGNDPVPPPSDPAIVASDA
jgi:hypothetical protein